MRVHLYSTPSFTVEKVELSPALHFSRGVCEYLSSLKSYPASTVERAGDMSGNLPHTTVEKVPRI